MSQINLSLDINFLEIVAQSIDKKGNIILIKVAKRRSYGLAKATTISQRLFLDLQGYECCA